MDRVDASVLLHSAHYVELHDGSKKETQNSNCVQ